MNRSMILAVCLLPLAVSSSSVRAADAAVTSWKETYNAGQKAIDDGQYDKAVEILARAETLATSSAGKAPSANGQGLALLRARKYAEAVGHFEQALKYDPNYLISKKNLGFTEVQLYTLGLADKSALEKAVEVLGSVPDTEASSLGEAKALLDAETRWAQAAAAPAAPAGATWRDLAAEGDAAEADGHFDHAVKCYAQAEAMSKTPASKGAACNRQGLALMKARKYEDAVGHLERAAKTDSSNKTFLSNLGLCHLRLFEKNAEGDHLGMSLDALRKVKEIDPSYKPESLALAEEYAAKAESAKANAEPTVAPTVEPTAVPAPATKKKS